MVNSIYCFSCGAKHSYGLAKPKFCSSCGTAMSGDALLKKGKVAECDDDDEEDDDDDAEVPDIDELDVETSVSQVYNTVSLGSIFDPTQNHQTSPIKQKRQKLDSKKRGR